ncbi:hypothetical protein B0J13DRAFT_550517 [Dactylonectria estremocensis]|uniref:Xylanolytic transcriptional activator regulatory domain-containing protein n=1 Tax=Dactylonectria estremocensis TaxID=1079267 RepID=A0A9P9J3Z0_9HYPO|nr:hypothetical protein B0J13DRAFT_550517 [Dactylonectria estremocensis]
MRSVIACDRRSKIKCKHDGQPPCTGCVKSQNTQTCSLSGPILRTQRSPASPPLRALKRKRSQHAESLETLRISRPEAAEHANISHVFGQIPRDRFVRAANVFQSQFPELGFLHPSDLDYDEADIDAVQMLRLLALLAVSSRHLDGCETSFNASNVPLVTKELHSRLVSAPSLYLVQAFLILSLCNWGEGNGFNAWMHAGIASRMAQGLLGTKLSNIAKGSMSELEKRTLWSCFAVDKLLSCGKRRQTMFDLVGMEHLFPLNDADFAFGERNAPLGHVPARISTIDFGPGDFFLIIIKGLHIWSKIHSWTAEGGRRQSGMAEEEQCPWQESSQWSRMMRELLQWRSSQNVRLRYPETKVSSHAHLKQAEKFGYVNLIYYVSVLFLRREYIPFVPVGETKPRGPIEMPLLKSTGPDTFWETNLEELAHSAVQISNLLRDLRRANSSIRTPFSGLCAFSAALMSLYSAAFPEFMGFTREQTSQAENEAQESIRDLHETGRMWKIADEWIEVTDAARGLFSRVTSEIHGWKVRRSRYDYPELEESIHLVELKGMPQPAASAVEASANMKDATPGTNHGLIEEAIEVNHLESPKTFPEDVLSLMDEDEWRLWSFWDDPHLLPNSPLE